MCLGIPMKIASVDGVTAVVAAGDVRQNCDLSLVEGARVGDYVIVHAGFAIEIVDEEDARETLAMLRQMGWGVDPEA